MQVKQLAESIEMPKLAETVEKFDLSPEEREIYGILVEEDELTAAEKLKILRQFVLNPRLLDSTPDVRSSKVEAVSSALQETFTEKDKVVMFVNSYVEGVMRGDQTIIDQLDIPEDVDVFTIDGSIPKEYRLAIQEELKQTGRKVLLVVSGQTADVGVDFSAAEEVYFYNEPWTEYDKLQQRGRVYRPGLKQNLKVRTFVAAGTIEDGIHRYIQTKHRAVEKLLRGVPISELEREMVRAAEKQTDESDLEVNRDLAEYYFSSWDKMMRIYGHVKELGEDDFRKFLDNYDVDYAESYANLVGSRSYQANVARLSGTLIDAFTREQGKDPSKVRILDVASGPEMLRRHTPEELQDRIVSLDINRHHFDKSDGRQTVGSFSALPIADGSVDYVNLSLGLHYTSFVPSKGRYERLGVFTELNRVLKTGGRGVIDMIYSLEFATDADFEAAMSKLGFRVVQEYTGVVEDEGRFRSQVITLEKNKTCEASPRELASEIGPQGIKAIKFKKTKASLRDSRKIATTMTLGQSALNVSFNTADKEALLEEQEVLGEMDGLKKQFGRINQIPRDEIISRGLSRIFNGRRYVLFKRLQKGSGAVVVR
jgi:ubiquinone/menaquinone biosynthesis C-methylase UbiE